MGKLSDFNFVYDIQLQAFKDEVRNIINYGKVALSVVTTAPTWIGQKGEQVLLMPSTGGTTYYYYHGTAWVSGWSNTV